MQQRVLLLGATGYIGGAIAKLFYETANIECYALVRASSNICRLKMHCDHIVRSKANRFSQNDIEHVLRKYNITCLINVVWLRNYSESEWAKMSMINRDIKQHWNNIFNAVSSYDPSILIVMTSGNFSLHVPSENNVIVSTLKPNYASPVIPVDKFKQQLRPVTQANVFQDNLVDKKIQEGYNIVIAYPCSVYGSSPAYAQCVWDHRFVEYFKNPTVAMSNTVIHSIWSSWIHVSDVAQAYLKIISKKRKEKYYLIGNEDMSVAQLAMKLAKSGFIQHKNREYLIENMDVVGNVQNIHWDTKSVQKLLGFKCKHSLNNQESIKDWCQSLQRLLMPSKL